MENAKRVRIRMVCAEALEGTQPVKNRTSIYNASLLLTWTLGELEQSPFAAPAGT